MVLAAVLAAGGLLPGLAVAGGKSHTVASDASVEITVTPWIDNMPKQGMTPVAVRIVNRAPQERAWEFVAKQTDYRAGEMSGHFAMRVPAGGTASGTFLINVLPDSESSGRGYKNVNISVVGPSVPFGMGVYLTTSSSGSSGSSSSAKWSPFIGVSEQFDQAHRKAFKGVVEDQMHLQWQGDTVSMAQAPLDWRGYTSLAQLWLMDSEWNGLSEAQRQTMLTWVGAGGNVCMVVPSPETLPTLPQGLEWKDGLRHGAGSITLVPSFKIGESISSNVKALSNKSEVTSKRDKGQERLFELVPPLTLRGKLIFSFILIFGVMVGPVNLFYFARGNNRPRLFWTTPLISFTGAAVLVAVMFLQDGTGGTGARVLLATMLPQQKQMVVLQEQYSKTGVLLGRSFDLPEHESTWLMPIPTVRVVKARYGGTEERQEKRNYAQDDIHASGGWFASRALQSQLLQSVRLNRGGIDLKEGANPTVISSLASPLSHLYVMDSKQQMWVAEKVPVGQSIPLKQVSRDQFNNWLQSSAQVNMGDLMRSRMEAGIPASGPWFFAQAAEPAKLAIPTLNSIRWEHDRAYITGPVTIDSAAAK
ncbi:MAG: hypothetical protein JWO08_4333 [Verrucomicrobiaceae bacterium]|nr:hypothetical protein [Verrucomicrobiaceae bacterium]